MKPAGWIMNKRCVDGTIGGIGECLFCDAESGVACQLVSEESCPGHVAHRLDAKYCKRCGIHIDSLRPGRLQGLTLNARNKSMVKSYECTACKKNPAPEPFDINGRGDCCIPKQPCDYCGKPVRVNAVSPSQCYCSDACHEADYEGLRIIR